jgi:hypothetical protein
MPEHKSIIDSSRRIINNPAVDYLEREAAVAIRG